MNSRWVSLNDAVGILGVSLSTLRRRIEKGEIESKLENGRRLVCVPDETQVDSNITQSTQASLIAEFQNEVQELRQRLEREERRSENLQMQLDDARKAAEEASNRHDTVVMQMTRLLEYHQQPFWRKLFSRKALPPPEQIMDMEPGDDKAKE